MPAIEKIELTFTQWLECPKHEVHIFLRSMNKRLHKYYDKTGVTYLMLLQVIGQSIQFEMNF